MSHDHEILDVLDQLDPIEYSGELWRTTWLKRDPLLGGTGGGRWSPNKKPETLYTSLEENTSIAELHYHLSQAPVRSSCAVLICQLSTEKLNLLDLRSPDVWTSLQLDNKSKKEQVIHSQKIGAVAHFLDYQGIIVPSYRAEGHNCVIFTELTQRDQITVESKAEINWPAWIKKRKVSK